MLQAEKATSPDGRFVATLTTQYFQTLGIGTEDMNATVEVIDAATGELVWTEDWTFERNKRFVETGREVTGIAFDASGNLQVGDRDEHIETIVLPGPGEISSQQLLRRTESALSAAFPDRAVLLVDAVRTLFWGAGASLCRACGPLRERTPGIYVCSSCEALFDRRVIAGTPPVLAMAVAEAVRAVAAHAPDADLVSGMLSARAALVPAISVCPVCNEDPAVDPLDIRSPVGRACATCVRYYSLKASALRRGQRYP